MVVFLLVIFLVIVVMIFLDVMVIVNFLEYFELNDDMDRQQRIQIFNSAIENLCDEYEIDYTTGKQSGPFWCP